MPVNVGEIFSLKIWELQNVCENQLCTTLRQALTHTLTNNLTHTLTNTLIHILILTLTYIPLKFCRNILCMKPHSFVFKTPSKTGQTLSLYAPFIHVYGIYHYHPNLSFQYYWINVMHKRYLYHGFYQLYVCV